MKKTGSKKRKKSTAARNGRASAKGQEILASLKALVEAAEAGIPLDSRFVVRTYTIPDAPDAKT